MIPRYVTARYVSNILNKGRNDTFELASLTQQTAHQDGLIIGRYYEAILNRPFPDHSSEKASGVTPRQAVQRTLSKMGVIFKE